MTTANPRLSLAQCGAPFTLEVYVPDLSLWHMAWAIVAWAASFAVLYYALPPPIMFGGATALALASWCAAQVVTWRQRVSSRTHTVTVRLDDALIVTGRSRAVRSLDFAARLIAQAPGVDPRAARTLGLRARLRPVPDAARRQALATALEAATMLLDQPELSLCAGRTPVIFIEISGGHARRMWLDDAFASARFDGVDEPDLEVFRVPTRFEGQSLEVTDRWAEVTALAKVARPRLAELNQQNEVETKNEGEAGGGVVPVTIPVTDP